MEIKKENYFYTKRKDNVIETMSLEDLQNGLEMLAMNLKKNNKCPCSVPVYFVHDGKKYTLDKWSIVGAFGKEHFIQIEFDDYNEIQYIAPDSRPTEGEYWDSRGVSDGLDVSVFVVSKKAGERLRRMVRLVLEKDETESWLDYREREPKWIQFKFSAKEFDVNYR